MSDRYKGREITRQTITITKAGDGLSKALEADGVHDFGFGDDVFVLLHTTCEAHTIEPNGKKEAGLKAKLVTQSATIMDDERVARQMIEEQQARIAAHLQSQKEEEQLALDAVANADPLGVYDPDKKDPTDEVKERRTRNAASNGDDKPKTRTRTHKPKEPATT